jgi:hypothetical protein
MNEVRRADASLVRRVSLFAVVGTVLGAGGIALFDRDRAALLAWVAADPQPRARLLLGAVALAAVAPLLAFAVYVWRIGARILEAGQFPPPGLRVVRDTAIVTGQPAIMRGRLLRALAVTLAGGAVGLAVLLWRLESLFARP